MCWKCGNSIDTKLINRDTVCSFCGNYLRCCMNCRFYEPGSHYDCHETIDEPVNDKESANFCDSFSIKTVFQKADGQNSSSTGFNNKKIEARNAFNSLFGD